MLCASLWVKNYLHEAGFLDIHGHDENDLQCIAIEHNDLFGVAGTMCTTLIGKRQRRMMYLTNSLVARQFRSYFDNMQSNKISLELKDAKEIYISFQAMNTKV